MNNPTIIGKATLHNMDCMDLLKATPDKFYDLAIVDPPYGIGISSKPVRQQHKKKNWDNNIPVKEYFQELQRVSKNQIIWGGNYFIEHLPSTQGFVIWDKVQPQDFSLAMAEFAWSSFQKPAKIFKRSVLAEKDKQHPTQKPVALYEWLIANYANEGQKILDTHLGSGSNAIACNNLGYELTACELDKDYFDASVKRIKQAAAQERLFA
jgi:site-specific DNA-methyltransferase (adenine-specific)